jgi:sulfopyruvate decarboxylase subunit alpha
LGDDVSDKSLAVGRAIAEELAACGVTMVASLPDNWVMGLINALESDKRFIHIPVNREESAVGLCSGAYFGAMGSAALMGASGFMTLVYAITKINYTYELPLFLMLTLRGELGDLQKHHISNGLYMRTVMDGMGMPYRVIDRPEDIGLIRPSYQYTRTFSRPIAVVFTRDFLLGS